MKILIGIIIVIFILIITLVISYINLTSFVNDISIDESENGGNKGIIQPLRGEVKMYVFAAETIMKPAYKSIVKMCELNGNETVMDFGSGAGPSSKLIANELENGTGQLTCLDISETWLKVVKHRFRDYDHVNYLLGDVTKMELIENTFDVILIHFVLHDINKEIRPDIIEKLASILKRGGSLVIREPASSDHGMPGEEIHKLMHSAGLQERIFRSGKIMLFVPVVEGIFYKK